jgi:polyhydroxyalkanoate synthase
MSADKGETGQSLIPANASRELLAALGQVTGGLSPQHLGGALWNVASHLALAPGRQLEIAQSALQKAVELARFTGSALQGADEPIAPQAAGTPYAHRFADPTWSKFPFNVLAQSFLTASELARTSLQDVPGSDARSANLVDFMVREGLELLAPDNYLPTNPQLLELTRAERGQNLLRGVK